MVTLLQSPDIIPKTWKAAIHNTFTTAKGRAKTVMSKKKQTVLPYKLNKNQEDRVNRYLDRLYNDIGGGGAYSSPQKLLHEVRRRGDYANLGLKRIKNYLDSQATYTLYKPAVRRYQTTYVQCDRFKQQVNGFLMYILAKYLWGGCC